MKKVIEQLSLKVPGFKYLLIAMVAGTVIWSVVLIITYQHVRAIREEAIAALQQAKLEEEEHIKVEKIAASDSLKFDQKTHRLMAFQYMEQKQYSQAIPHFKRFVHLTNQQAVIDDHAPAILLVEAYIKSRRPKEGLLLILELKTLLGDEPSLILKEGEAHLLLGNHGKAAELFRQAIRLDPKNSIAHSLLAQVISLNDPLNPEVESLFNNSIEIDDKSVDNRYRYGVYLEKNGRYMDAIEVFNQILTIEPFHSLSIGRLGMLHYYNGNKEDAKKMYELAISINGTDYNTMYNLGELYLTSYSDAENGYKWFLKSVSIKPDHVSALKKLGIIAMTNRNYKEALIYFEKCEKARRKSVGTNIVIDEEIVKMNILQATVYESLSQKDNARKYYEKALAQDPVNRIARHKLALLDQ
jgi:tetratricopeptide (TPR) repeat protein